MRKVILTIAVALAVGTWALPAAAQDRGHHGQHDQHDHDPAAHVEELRERLDLTDEQTARIRAIVTEGTERGRAIHEGRRDEASRDAHHALHEEIRTRVAEVLTDGQRAKLEEMHREEGQRHRDHHDDHGNGDPVVS